MESKEKSDIDYHQTEECIFEASGENIWANVSKSTQFSLMVPLPRIEGKIA